MYHTAHVADIRTSLRQHLHSLPPSHRSPYLECHMLARQKERLEKEATLLEIRCQQCWQRVADLEARMRSLTEREEVGRPASGLPAESARDSARVATMTLEY